MSFHLGKPLLVMLVIAVIGGGVSMFARKTQEPRPDLLMWGFADSHLKSYRAVTPQFERLNNVTVRYKLIGFRAENIRLGATFMSGVASEEAPDLAEVESGTVGQYFRPPLDEVGFLPLNGFLENHGAREIASVDFPGYKGWHARLRGTDEIYTHDGTHWVRDTTRTKPDVWFDRIVRNRLMTWSKEGVVFGIPHDVHPTAIAFRKDLYDEAGVDLESAKTWPQFQEKCLQFQEYWRTHGRPDRHPMEIPEADVGRLTVMLQQRGINLVDSNGQIHMKDPKVVETMVFYAQLIAGPRAIAAESAPGTGPFALDLTNGNICAYMAADWRIHDIRLYGGEKLMGKMRLMPLPKFEPTDAPTAPMGGTMLGIAKTCKNPQLAWKLIEHIYLSPESLEARRRETDILPPLKDAWRQPTYHEPDPFFGGQKATELLTELAEQIPTAYVTPANNTASADLTAVLTFAVAHARQYGSDGLRATVEHYLDIADRDVRRRVQRVTFPSQPKTVATAAEITR